MSVIGSFDVSRHFDELDTSLFTNSGVLTSAQRKALARSNLDVPGTDDVYTIAETNDLLDDKLSIVDLDSTVASKNSATVGASKIVSLDGSNNIVIGNIFSFEPITNFGALSGGTAAATKTVLDVAVATHSLLYIPAGTWRVNALTANSCTWLIDAGATFPDLATVGPYGQTNLEVLGGRIFRISNNATTKQGMRIGDGNPWSETYRPFSISIAEFSVTAQFGNLAVAGWSRASDNPTVNQGTIGGEFGAVNDDTVNLKPVFGVYAEAWRTDDSVGAALGSEIEAVNKGALNSLTPYTVRSINSKDSISYVAASGGEIVGATTATAAYVMWKNGADYERGFVVMKDALLASGPKEFVTTYTGTFLAWYDDTNLAASYITDTNLQFSVRSDTVTTGHGAAYKRKRANGTTATGTLDEIKRDTFYGWDGTVAYDGAYMKVLQRTAFAGSQARFSVEWAAKNSSGTYRTIGLNEIGDDVFGPDVDNVINFGTSTIRLKTVNTALLRLIDGVTAPSTVSGTSQVYTDVTDGDLKVIFGDGVIKRLTTDVSNYTTIATDTDFTMTVSSNSLFTRHTGVLTANRAITLATTNAIAGDNFRLTRTGVDIFNLSVGGLKNLITGTWCEVVYDGAAWYLSAYGTL